MLTNPSCSERKLFGGTGRYSKKVSRSEGEASLSVIILTDKDDFGAAAVAERIIDKLM